MTDKTQMAEQVIEAYGDFTLGLGSKRRYPTEQFQRFFVAAKAYAEATRSDEMIHRSVASCLNGLREYLEVERKRVPSGILFNADRLETMLFSGHDPFFEGDEPPGL